MAPKRGGGGGGISLGGSGNSINNRCVYSDTISHPIVIARLVVDGASLGFLLLLSFLWILALKRNPNIKQLLRWYTFGALLACSIIYLILAIIGTVLSNCLILGFFESAELNVATSVFSELSNLLALGIVLLPLTLHLLRRAGQKTTVVNIINTVTVGTVALVFVPFIVISSMSNIEASSLFRRPSLAHVSVKLGTSYYFIYFIATVIGSVVLVFALIKAAGDVALNLATKLWTIFTIITLLIGSIAVVVEMFGWALTNRNLTNTGWIAFLIIFQVFFVLTIFGILQTASNAAFPLVDPTNNATYDPDAPEEVQPELHKRFTYTGSEIQPPPHYQSIQHAYQYQVSQQQQHQGMEGASTNGNQRNSTYIAHAY